MDEDISLSIDIQSDFKTCEIRSSSSVDTHQKSCDFFKTSLIIVEDIKTDNIDHDNRNETYTKSDDCFFKFPVFEIASEKNHRECEKYRNARKSILNYFQRIA